MAKKTKFYVVWDGHNPGIYTSWPECQRQIKNYPNAKYKAFKTKMEAEDAYHGQFGDYIGKNAKPKALAQPNSASLADVVWDSISVDAACSGNPGVMEYRGVDTKTGTELFRMGPFAQGTNNVGEFLALVHGLALLKKEGKTIPIYSDSKIAMGWVEKKVFRSKLKRSYRNEKLFFLVERGLQWIKDNTWENEILKWETKNWGEIPADFGRK